VVNIITKKTEQTKGAMLMAAGGNLAPGFGTLQYGNSIGQATNFRIYSQAGEGLAFSVFGQNLLNNERLRIRGHHRKCCVDADKTRRIRQGEMDILISRSQSTQFPFVLRAAGLLILSVMAGASFSGIARAQSDQLSDYDVKAAFLFNFTKFVEWPESSFESPQAPIVIGIIGDSPFGDSLTRIVAGQKAQGRGIEIIRYRRGDDLRRCNVLFISDSERQRSAQILASLQPASILTVSDMDGFAEAGGAIQFVIQDNRVRFIVNLDAATQSKLRASAKLLALARVINHSEAAR
jgi:PPE-repeat protein